MLRNAIATCAIEKSELKTSNFIISTKYESEKNREGNYVRIFKGYECSHDLCIEFPLDLKQLSFLISSIASCGAIPKFDILFSIKNKNEVSEQLLFSAVENAKSKAEILAKASGVALGENISIDYNWGEMHVLSNSRYNDFLEEKAKICSAEIEIEQKILM